jgi:hypothetical protein
LAHIYGFQGRVFNITHERPHGDKWHRWDEKDRFADMIGNPGKRTKGGDGKYGAKTVSQGKL